MKKSTNPYLQTRDISGKFIFICYSHFDRKIVEPILEQFSKDGYRFWFDDGTRSGEAWQKIVSREIRKCTVFLFLISENTMQSDNCRDELTYAKNNRKTIVPVFLSKVTLESYENGVDFQLVNCDPINFYEYEKDELPFFFKTLYDSENINLCKRSDKEQHEFLKKIGQADDPDGEKSADETKKKNEPKQPTKPVVMNSPVKNTDGGHDDENYIPYVTYIFKKLKEFFNSKCKKDDISFDTDTITLPARTNRKKKHCSSKKEKIVDIFTNILSSKATKKIKDIVLTVFFIALGIGNMVRLAFDIHTFVLDPTAFNLKDRLVMCLHIASIGLSIMMICIKEVTVTSNMFWGEKECADRNIFLSRVSYQKVMVDGFEIEISAIPFYTNIDPTCSYILLEFLDRFGKEYYFYDSLPSLFGIEPNLHNNCSMQTVTPEQAYSVKATVLPQNMSFWSYFYNGEIHLIAKNFKSSVALKNKQDGTNGYFTLRGTATKDCFNELKYISISYSPDGDAKVEKLMFDDSGTPINVSVKYTPNKNRILIKWEKEERMYNGRMETFSNAGDASFQFVNTAPYGFVLIHGKKTYSYQAEADPAFFESDTEK